MRLPLSGSLFGVDSIAPETPRKLNAGAFNLSQGTYEGRQVAIKTVRVAHAARPDHSRVILFARAVVLGSEDVHGNSIVAQVI